MSNLRQLDNGVLVRSFGVTFNLKTLTPPASDGWDQLVYAVKGVVTVRTDTDAWVVPPHRGMWLPAGTGYTLSMSGQTALRMIYLASRANAGPGFDRSQCAVASVSSLLRELILRTVQVGALVSTSSHHSHLAGLIEDEIDAIGTVPLQLPYPKSDTAKQFAESIDVGFDGEWNEALAIRNSGAGRRTLERRFREETGMSLGQWLRRRKLLFSLESLHRGESIGAIAFALGYSTPSAFIAMFKRELGSTPGEYLLAP